MGNLLKKYHLERKKALKTCGIQTVLINLMVGDYSCISKWKQTTSSLTMFVTHFKHRVANRDISKYTLLCLQYLGMTDLGLSIHLAKVYLSGHPHLPLDSWGHTTWPFILRCSEMLFLLMVLVAEEHNGCVKEWEWLEKITSS